MWVVPNDVNGSSEKTSFITNLCPFQKCLCDAKHLDEKQEGSENPLQQLFSSSIQPFIYSTNIYQVFIVDSPKSLVRQEATYTS